jgi:hypothetical protein
MSSKDLQDARHRRHVVGTPLGVNHDVVSLRDNTVAQKASTLNYSHSLEFYDHFDILHVDNCVVSFHHKVD